MKKILSILGFSIVFAGTCIVAPAAASSLSTTTLATAGLDSKGIQNDVLPSDYHALSADGRILVYSANSHNLVPNDTNPHTEIFAYDQTTKKTERVSVANNGGQTNGDSYTPTVSADGRYVAFISNANNIVVNDNVSAGCTNQWSCWNIYVYDRQSKHSIIANVNTLGFRLDTTLDESTAAISANGRFVAFQSKSSISPTDTNNENDILVRDLDAYTTRLVSGGPPSPDEWEESTHPSISADGRYVAFNTYRSLTPDDKNSSRDIYVYDQQADIMTRASKSAYNAEWNSDSFRPKISSDGHSVVFESAAALLPRDTNKLQDIYEYDLRAGKTILVSTATDGALANGYSFRPTVSADGELVAFESDATNLTRVDTNSESDIFIHYRDFGTTRRVSMGLHDSTQANDANYYGTISGDGKTVSFESPATNLTPQPLAKRAYNLYMNQNPVVTTPYYDSGDFLGLF